QLVSRFHAEDDIEAISAAYALAAHGEAAVPCLMETFCSDDIVGRTVAAYGFAPMGEVAVPHLLKRLEGADEELTARIADVLGDMGPRARASLPSLAAMLTHADPVVRRYAAEAIGIVGQGVDAAPPELVGSLCDDDALTRRNAALAIARLGRRAARLEGLVEALRDNLYHDHHHVRGWAIEALQRLDSADATAVVWRYLQTVRWDSQPRSGDVRAPAPVNVRPKHRAS
ncbi:MAG: HEAT repeat domain-containing protein, partial [Pseudomonadales bacterium]